MEVSNTVPGVLQYVILAEAAVFSSRGSLSFLFAIKKLIQQKLEKKQKTGNCATETTCEITGLQAGTDYEITVRGTYAAGDTSENGPSNTFTTGLHKSFFCYLEFRVNINFFIL